MITTDIMVIIIIMVMATTGITITTMATGTTTATTVITDMGEVMGMVTTEGTAIIEIYSIERPEGLSMKFYYKSLFLLYL